MAQPELIIEAIGVVNQYHNHSPLCDYNDSFPGCAQPLNHTALLLFNFEV